MKIEDFVLWEDRVAVLNCADGECMAAHILTVDNKCNKLIVHVLESNRPYDGRYSQSFAVSPDNVSSVVPVAVYGDADKYVQWDTCQADRHFCPDRFVLFAICVFAMLLFSFIAIKFSNVPGVVQIAAAIIYSAAIVLYTFSSNSQGWFRISLIQPFHFTCPFVRRQLPRLILRHIWFLLGLVLFLTVGLLFAPYLPDSWLQTSGRGGFRPFQALLIPCAALAALEILLNRSLLKRAHPEISSLDVENDTGFSKSRF